MLITEPTVLDEARDFRVQEQIHSQVHRKHCKTLIAQKSGARRHAQGMHAPV